MLKALFIISGIFSAAFGLKGFLIPNQFIDGGVTGVSLLIHRLLDIPIALLIPMINLPFIFIGYRQISREFAALTVLAIAGLSLVLAFVPFPFVTEDKLLTAVFGGLFIGGGIGLTIRGGAVIDGTEVLGVYLSRKSSLTIGDIILLINLIIFTFAALFLGIEAAMYSVLTYLSASKTVDFIIQGIEEYTGITIVSMHSDEIKSAILHKVGRGVTVYKGERGFTADEHEDKTVDIIFSVITRLEIAKLKAEVNKIDPEAFIIMHTINEIKGGIIKRRPLH